MFIRSCILAIMFAYAMLQPAKAQDRITSGTVRPIIADIVVPKGALTSMTIGNLLSPPDADGKARSCRSVSGQILVLKQNVNFAGVGDATPIEARSARLPISVLDQVDFLLETGKSLPLQVVQPFQGLAAIGIAISVPPQQRRCLASSAITVQDENGAVLSIVPQAAFSFSESLSAFEISVPRCCPCAPVCACGFCD